MNEIYIIFIRISILQSKLKIMQGNINLLNLILKYFYNFLNFSRHFELTTFSSDVNNALKIKILMLKAISIQASPNSPVDSSILLLWVRILGPPSMMLFKNLIDATVCH